MFRYNESGEIIEIIIRDFSGAKIESYRFKVKDIEKAKKVFRMLKDKYGVSTITKDRDIGWLK